MTTDAGVRATTVRYLRRDAVRTAWAKQRFTRLIDRRELELVVSGSATRLVIDLVRDIDFVLAENVREQVLDITEGGVAI